MLQATDYKPQSPGKATKVDRLVRWVIIPTVFIIGLGGLVFYVITGVGQDEQLNLQPTEEASIVR